MPPLFVIGPEGDGQLVNYRVRQNYYIVDRLFAAAELRLGGEHQQKVRIVPHRREAVVSDDRQQDVAPDPIRPASDPVAALRLRPARPRVTRLSRKVLTGGAAIALVAISGAVFWALQNNRHRTPRLKSFTAPIIAPRRTDWPACRAIMPAFRGKRRRSARRCPATSAGPCSTPAPRRTRLFRLGLRRSGVAAACAGDRGGAVEPAVRIDKYPGVALGHADTRVGSNRQMPAPRRVRPRSH